MKILIDTLKHHPLLLLVGIIPIFVLGIAIASLFIQSPSSTQPTLPTWNNLKIGEGKDQVINSLGQPSGVTNTHQGEALEYPSQYPQYPNQVVLENNKDLIVKEQVDVNNPRFIKDFLPNPQSSPIIGYFPEQDESQALYIYPSDGVAFLAHISNQSVYEVWYFEPTTIEQIKQTWGKELTDLPQLEHPF